MHIYMFKCSLKLNVIMNISIVCTFINMYTLIYVSLYNIVSVNMYLMQHIFAAYGTL